MNGATIPTVKVEQHYDGSIAIDHRVKHDPDSLRASPSAHSEDDIYEDTGDLDFSQAHDVRLMRIPSWLWEKWSEIDDDQDIQLGTVRVEKLGRDKNGASNQKMTLLLSPSVSRNKDVPREYNMNLTNPKSSNVYIFSEKDLPGYRSRGVQRGPPAVANSELKGGKLSRPEKDDKGALSKPDRGKRWQPYIRKAIPKNTALVGVVRKEINCLPIENEEYARIMTQRAKEAQAPKRETELITGVGPNAGNLLAPGHLGAGGNFGNFIKTGATQRTKGQEHKAARIPQNELLDLIYDCFKRYNYWPLKSMKATLNQPEAYLRSTLEMVAELVKSGRFAMTWTLKPENRIVETADLAQRDELAPDAGYGLDGASEAGEGHDEGGGAGTGEEDDDDEVDMEDVLL